MARIRSIKMRLKLVGIEETRGFIEYIHWMIEGVIIDALIEAKREA